jgi:nickel/cobalt exporter
MKWSWLVAVLLTLSPGHPVTLSSCHGHPVPSDNHDRTLIVRLTPEAVRVTYRLEVNEARAALDLSRAELAGVSSRAAFADAYARLAGPRLAAGLEGRLDGRPLTFRLAHHEHRLLDHLRCDFLFIADWRPGDGAHSFSFREGNYPEDDFSKLHLTLTDAFGLRLRQRSVPSPELLARPTRQLGPGEAERLRSASGTFVLVSGEQKGVMKPALPPDLADYRAPPGLRSDGPVAVSRKGPGDEAVAEGKGSREREPAGGEDAPPAHTLLELLLESRLGMGVLLLLAAAFGAVHALTPGHGKTLVAAYLVGERGTFWHAVFLGLTTTFTHTAAVIVLAALLPIFFPGQVPTGVQTALGLIGGLLVAGLGLWLLLTRLTGRADHFHIGGGHHHHHHHHDHDHDHDHTHDPSPATPDARPSWWGLVVLGVSGGLVPCWDAIAMLCFAISARKLWLAVPLLLAFSAGLAGVLVAIGIGVVYAKSAATARWGENSRWQQIARALPLISAVLVTVLGLWLCFDSVRGAHLGP